MGPHPIAAVGPAPLDFKTHITEICTVSWWGGGFSLCLSWPPLDRMESSSWAVCWETWLNHCSSVLLAKDPWLSWNLKTWWLNKKNFKKNQQKHYITARKPQCGKVCSQLPYFFLFWQNQVCQAAPRGLALSGQLISSFCNRYPTKQGITVVPI